MSYHPYKNLPKHAFWKTAVADLDSRQIDLAWKPKAPITRATKIITVGSCFAQHISHSLKENGFSWIDSEPAPASLPQAEHAKNGYGVFSFRTGNIYTAALLKQWVMWATGKAEQSKESFLDDGRYYDPFRPSVTEDGFSSAEEMLAARQTTLAAMIEAIKQADVFIFTLGLTEAWLNKDGSVYPMCPGTIRGTFSTENHIFHNYNDMEVVTDLADTFDALRSINPNLRFLLTVSPVPLTATASGEHVLMATTYSKAVLRSAAGYFTQMIGDTEYFPSYELITAPAFKGQFFEKNMRSVTSEGVAFVMGQFFRAIGVVSAVATPNISLVAKEIISSVFETTESETDICDDIILETWSNKPIDDAEESPNILLIGTSHMGMIAKVLDEQHIRYAGGATMNSSDWHTLRFDLDEEKLFLPRNPEQKARWENTYYASFAKSMPSSSKPIIITDVGLHKIDVPSKDFFEYLDQIYGPGPHHQIEANHLHHYLLMSRRTHLALLCKFMARGYSVLVVTEPPIEPIMIDLCTMIDSFFCDFYRSVGCSVFSARDWIKELGGMPQEFRSTVIHESSKKPDHIHGSPEYYRQLTKEIFSRFSITPEYLQGDRLDGRVS